MIPDRYNQGVVQRRVDMLRPGDRVDLQNDIFADPEGESDFHIHYEYEFAVVEEVIRETDDCICVYFETTPPVGFPPDHWVDVDGEQGREAA